VSSGLLENREIKELCQLLKIATDFFFARSVGADGAVAIKLQNERISELMMKSAR